MARVQAAFATRSGPGSKAAAGTTGVGPGVGLMEIICIAPSNQMRSVCI